jgi:hypothetical protein
LNTWINLPYDASLVDNLVVREFWGLPSGVGVIVRVINLPVSTSKGMWKHLPDDTTLVPHLAVRKTLILVECLVGHGFMEASFQLFNSRIQ